MPFRKNVVSVFKVGALAVVLVVAGCNKNSEKHDNDAGKPAPPVTQAPVATPPTAASPTAMQSAPPAPAPAANSALLSGTIATTQGEIPGITIAIQELKRSYNTLTLKFAMINQSKNDFAFAYNFGEGNEFGSIGGIHLIDAANKKKYFVVRDTDGACVCSRSVANISVGSQSVLWAKFPAPPDDVQKITVEIPHFPPLEDVPVTR